MDVGTYLQSFENSLHNYSGDDPLDPWDRFVKFLEGTLPLEERKAVSVVLDRLVQRFLHEERYQNDPRYVDNCIKCASLYDDPIKVYSYLNSQGIGTRAAALYIAWAQQFEKDGQLRQAEAVYQIAVENQAQPVDTVLQHYGMFQSKVLKRQAGTTGMHAFSKDVPRNPLQNSQLTNQQSRPREILQCKESDLPQFPDNRTVHIISKSECNPPKAQSEPSQQVSMYYVSEVVCEGTEYSFEELRANRYFAKCKQQTELRRLEEEQRKAQEAEDKLREMQDLLKLLDNKSPVQPAHLQAPSRPHDGQQEGLTAASAAAAAAAAAQPELTTLTARTSAAHSNHLRHQLAPTFRLQLGLGARHKSMPFSSTVWEPAGSLGSLQPSAGLCPLKEVEASCSEVAFPQRASMAAAWSESSSPSPLPAVDAAFTSSSLRSLHTSLQHHHASNGHENMATLPIHRQEAAGMSEVPCGALNQMNHSVLTRAEPLQTHSNSFVLPLEEEHVVSKHGENADRSSEGANNVSQGNHSHITPNNSLGLIQATPSRVHPSPTVHTREALDLIMNMFQAPTFVPEVLSDIAEQSLNYGFPKTNEPAGPQPAAAAAAAAASSAPFTIFQDEEDKENGGQTPAANKQRPLQVRAEIPVSGTSQQNETGVGTESVTDETAMWGSRRHSLAPWPNNTQDFAQSAHLVSTPFHLSAPHSAQESVQENDAPTAFAGSDENHPFMRQPTQLSPIMEQSPADDKRSPPAQAPAPTVTPRAPCQLVSDPWDDVLINSLLSRLATPLTSLPNVSTWDCSLPSVSPKMTTTMAGESLRVDFVLGQGAFATVYQATNLTTSEKFFLKVQKPANPWEYYISMKLNIQLRPSVRHLFTNIHSAHLFKNGSILLGDLHNCGTLLNAINLYKSRSEKVMPQALVLYFTSCILHMVDELHSARIVHADIKPDNFMLGERFLENECFDPENTEHGLALIDLGQSIDMSLFPEGTAFTAKCMTSAFQCTEMLSGRPWNYQTDYFGIAGTVYCMIFGSYMQVKNEDGEWKPNGTFKRNPHRELWLEFFHTLLNVPDCSSLPSLQRLRSCVHAELQTHYGAKLRGIKNRLVVQLLESRSGRR